MEHETIPLPDGQIVTRNSPAFEELQLQTMAHAAAHAVGCRVFCGRHLGASAHASCARHAKPPRQVVSEERQETVARLGGHIHALLLVDIHQREFAASRDLQFYPAAVSWRDGAEIALWIARLEDNEDVLETVRARVRQSYDTVLRHEIDAIYRHMQVFGDLTRRHVARVLNALDHRVPIEETVNGELRRRALMAWDTNEPSVVDGRASCTESGTRPE